MSSGAWVRTAADALTAIAAAAGAGVGGAWAYLRYRREAPDMPRVNAIVSAEWFSHSQLEYLAADVELRHVSGGRLRMERDGGLDPPRPVLEVFRLTAEREPGTSLQSELVSSTEVFASDTELDSGEVVTDHKVLPVGPADPEVVAYEVVLRLVAGWTDQTWTWCTNAIVTVGGAQTAKGETTTTGRPG